MENFYLVLQVCMAYGMLGFIMLLVCYLFVEVGTRNKI